MTFDFQMFDTLNTPKGNKACLLMTSLCYVICKDSDIMKILTFAVTFHSLTEGHTTRSP